MGFVECLFDRVIIDQLGIYVYTLKYTPSIYNTNELTGNDSSGGDKLIIYY